MLEAPRDTYESAPLSWDHLQRLTAQTASYESFPSPEAVLRNGFVSEILEIQQETDSLDNEALSEEIGDALWYISEIARHKGIALSAALNWHESIDGYQHHASETAPPLPGILTPGGKELDPTANPEDAIAVYAARVVDTMQPKPDDPNSSLIWNGITERPTLEEALQDVTNCLCRVADSHGIALSRTLEQTIKKLESRPRKPHVIEFGVGDSQRWRLQPWIIAALEAMAR